MDINSYRSGCLVISSIVNILDVYQVLDDKNVRRRFRASNYQSTTRVKPFICTMPMRLDDGWNQIQFNLSDFTRRAYGTNYIETLRVQVGPSFNFTRINLVYRRQSAAGLHNHSLTEV